ncbi:MAG: hypothetical protein HY701_04020, partial [Gemmatimonadetes bacterium]|nr:hypothetical protein [Gemmatimonadota bacterium]
MVEVGVLGAIAAQLETMLARRLGAATSHKETDPCAPLDSGRESLDALRRVQTGALAGVDLSRLAVALDGLVRAAHLDESDHHVLGLVVLANLDDRVGRAIGLLHDDLSRTRPSIGLAVRALETAVPPHAAWQAAGVDSRLTHRGLITHAGSYGDPDAPVASRELVLHPRVLAALMRGGPLESPDPALRGSLRLEDTKGKSRRARSLTAAPLDEPAANGADDPCEDRILSRLAGYT